MSDQKCVCGHSESMHYAVSGACMKIITRDSSLKDHLRCSCKVFRVESVLSPRKSN